MNNDFLDWDSVIDDGEEFTTLEPGEYDFTVKKFERGRTTRGAKLAIVTLEVTDGTKRAVVTDRIALQGNTIWKISSYFRSLGMKKHGEKIKMDFEGSVGKSGRCTIFVDEYQNKNGGISQSNKIDQYLDPPDDFDGFAAEDDELPF